MSKVRHVVLYYRCLIGTSVDSRDEHNHQHDNCCKETIHIISP